MPHTITPFGRGLRERKKLKTKEAIQREALRLFAAQGYAETTIEQIAAAAESSPSTFFNYFPTKQDAVLFHRYDPMIFSMMSSIPPSHPRTAPVSGRLDGCGGWARGARPSGQGSPPARGRAGQAW